MIKVITYGTYDLLHYGHVRLLERAKALGDYLIVGVTSDDYDRVRGKINNQQTLMDRVKAVRDTGLADEIIIEEYEGQKIDDIKKFNIDIFTVGSDWKGYFDYLNEFCKVVYLPRTDGISSSGVRSEKRKLRLGVVGDAGFKSKIIKEASFVNGVDIVGLYTNEENIENAINGIFYTSDYDALLDFVDAVFIISMPERHYIDAKKALEKGKHVLCGSPIAFSRKECKELFALAKKKKLILMEAIKTAYSTAFERLVLLAKSGKVGEIVSVDATCTSLEEGIYAEGINLSKKWNSMCGWAPVAILPVFQIFGTDYVKKNYYTRFKDKDANMDAFSKVDFIYPKGIGTIKVAKGAKAEGELVISGTEGYIYVPAPWWKTEYFEIRYEDSQNNKRFFYQLEGEGIRYEMVAFAKAIETKKNISYIAEDISYAIAGVIEDFNNRIDMIEI